MTELYDVCRTCLINAPKLIDIFSAVETHTREYIKLAEMIQYFTDLLINEQGDNLPKQVCENCVCEIRQSYLFRKKVLEANEMLLSIETKSFLTEGTDNIKNEKSEFEVEYLDDEIIEEHDYEADEDENIKSDFNTNSLEAEELTDENENLNDGEEDFDDYVYEINIDDGKIKSIDEYVVPENDVSSLNEQVTVDGNRLETNVCTECTEEFVTQEELNKHKKIHTVRKFDCPSCEKSYSLKHILKRHILLKHPPVGTNVPEFTCDLCKKNLLTKSALESHKRLHTGDRPYKCDKCDKGFISKSSLSNHMPSHDPAGEPFPCDICEKVFSRAVNLYKHRRIHTAQKKHECTFCGKLFLSKQTCRLHIQSHMGLKPYRKYEETRSPRDRRKKKKIPKLDIPLQQTIEVPQEDEEIEEIFVEEDESEILG